MLFVSVFSVCNWRCIVFPPYLWLLYTNNFSYINLSFQIETFSYQEKYILWHPYHKRERKCFALDRVTFIYLFHWSGRVIIYVEELLFMELVIKSCFICCYIAAKCLIFIYQQLGKFVSHLRIIEANVVWGKKLERRLNGKRGRTCFRSRCLSFSSTVGNQSFSEKKTVQICFILDTFFKLVLLLSPTLCFLSDVMVRLKWSSLPA